MNALQLRLRANIKKPQHSTNEGSLPAGEVPPGRGALRVAPGVQHEADVPVELLRAQLPCEGTPPGVQRGVLVVPDQGLPSSVFFKKKSEKNGKNFGGRTQGF